jgi:hypothetical protein
MRNATVVGEEDEGIVGALCARAEGGREECGEGGRI